MGNVWEKFRPAYIFSAVWEIEPAFLREKGIKAIILDLDNTLLAKGAQIFPPQVLKWLRRIEEAGLRVCLVSNSGRRRVEGAAFSLGVPCVFRAAKPGRRPFIRALQILGTEPRQTAVIGDQLLTDVYGGKRLGMVTILVKPLPGKEFVGTRINRRLEKFIWHRLNRPEEG